MVGTLLPNDNPTMIDQSAADRSVAQQIRELIMSGDLAPGTRVAEAGIATRLGISRTPVRSAIPALAAEGLLEPAGRRGYAVRRFSVEDSFRATELRCLLEGYAARRIAERGAAPELVDTLRDCLAEGDRIFAFGTIDEERRAEYARVNGRFHKTIVAEAQDPLLSDVILRIYHVPFVAPDVVTFNNVDPGEVFEILRSGQHQHHAIVDAIVAGNADLAEALMRGHSSPARRSLGLAREAQSPPLNI
jgi:GntR family transcriptional regulator of vanillate catabolism